MGLDHQLGSLTGGQIGAEHPVHTASPSEVDNQGRSGVVVLPRWHRLDASVLTFGQRNSSQYRRPGRCCLLLAMSRYTGHLRGAP